MPATVAGTSETINARSRFLPLFEPLPVPSRLMSQNTPEAKKPLGAVTEPGMEVKKLFIEQNRWPKEPIVSLYFRSECFSPIPPFPETRKGYSCSARPGHWLL